jgi:hypothetical protein
MHSAHADFQVVCDRCVRHALAQPLKHLLLPSRKHGHSVGIAPLDPLAISRRKHSLSLRHKLHGREDLRCWRAPRNACGPHSQQRHSIGSRRLMREHENPHRRLNGPQPCARSSLRGLIQDCYLRRQPHDGSRELAVTQATLEDTQTPVLAQDRTQTKFNNRLEPRHD